MLKFIQSLEVADKKKQLSIIEKMQSDYIKVLQIALYPELNLGVKQLDIGRLSETLPNKLHGNEVTKLIALCTNALVNNMNNKTRQSLIDFIRGFNKVEGELLYKIITQTLRVGITANSLKKALGEPVFKVALASPKGSFGNELVVVQEKLDGVRFTVTKDKFTGELLARTRQGKRVAMSDDFNALHKVFEYLESKGIEVDYLDGEIESLDKNRRTISGKVTSAQRGSVLSKGDDVVFNIFDFKPAGKSAETLTTIDRVTFLNKYCMANPIADGSIYNVLDSAILSYNQERIDKMMAEVINKGGEGLIVKRADSIYKSGRTTNWVKVKQHNTCTLEVTGVYEGKLRLKGTLGGFIVSSSCGRLTTKVGTGLTDDERKRYTEYLEDPSKVIGKLVEVPYNQVTLDTKGEPVIDHPTWGGFRTDVERADSANKIINQG